MLTFENAERVMQGVYKAAAEENLDDRIAVAVVDSHGELVCYSLRDNVAFHAGVLARNKAYTAARDRKPSSEIGAWAKETGKGLSYWTDSRFTGIAGGVPLFLDGKVIGAVGVSGLDEFEDERLASAGLKASGF